MANKRPAAGGFFRSYHFPERNKADGADESGDKSDSPWAVIAGFVKGFNVSFEYALHDISYANILMYSSTLPSYDFDKGKRGKQEAVNGDDPKNREEVLSIIRGQKF